MATESILLLHGPNLDQLGTREPEIYGTATLAEHVAAARDEAVEHGYELEDFQSASDAELIAKIHEARTKHAGLIINAGALTHYAWSLHDALLIFEGPKVELHISNTGAREEWRHKSVITPAVDAVVMGFGIKGYPLAVQGILGLLR